MSVLGRYIKQPGEVETYSINYLDDLTTGDNVQSAVTTVAPAGLTIDYTQVIDTPTDKRVRVKVSGGTVDVNYKVTVSTTTADGRVLEDEFYVRIKEY